ncbi:hypothetical protein H5410_014786 [Solanum commersonii]|uniref:Uncharacterized protein n=1 Tax=Solanum commersonii TaxID=4109 RepID=A0A9J5ZSF3_SOLCO|nr:hypothetical protein H5410_014786 [Solanum commersonii]
MTQLHITEDMTLDRKEWRSRIKVEGCVRCYTSSIIFVMFLVVIVDYTSLFLSMLCSRINRFPSYCTWICCN